MAKTRIYSILLCSMLAVAPMEAQVKNKAVTFDSYKWGFGDINAEDGTICHTFTMKNNSKEEIRITKTVPSCDCIRAFYTTDAIKPGGEAKVMISLSPTKGEGKTFRSVELLDQNGRTLGSLTAFGNVKRGAAYDANHKYPYQDTNLTYQERVENLISLLTPKEKVGLMMNKSVSIDRLGIPSYNWWNEACHGVRQGGYTVYPQPIGMAAAFDSKLVYDVFSTVSDEARANWNRSDHNIFNVPMGVTYYPGNPELTYWCPNVNIFRDPRWGRGQETCGEDPYLNAVLGVQTVLGMQGNDDRYFKTHACAKHYAVHSGPEPLRHSYNATVSMRDLWETYLPAFKALVKKGNVREVMCAYNRYEGKPCCTSDRLLVDILRRKWGYNAIAMTDCDAINNFYNRGQHETHKDPLSASVDAVLNGTDLECGKVFMVLTEALDKGLIQESTLDEHLRKTLYGRFELGMFDPDDMIPWKDLKPEVISCESNNDLAVQHIDE